MKTVTKKFMLVILAIILTLPVILPAQENPMIKGGNKPLSSVYKIVTFMDLDPLNINVKLPDGSITTPTEFFFYRSIKASVDLGTYITKADYSTFFLNNSLDNFDIAIFPMGDNPLSYSAGGHTVMQDIDYMLSHGKRVIIQGRKILTNQFGGGSSDNFVGDFFTRTLGIQYLGRPNVAGKSYVAYGTPSDSISYNQIKWFNINLIPAGNPNQWPPWKYYNDVEVFKLNNGSVSIPVDSWTRDSRVDDGYMDGSADLTYYYNKPPNDTLCGIKASPKSGGKIVFWSVGFENACSWESIPFFAAEVLQAVRWCSWETGGLPWPESYLSFDQNSLNFGNVDLNKDSTMSIKLTNYGRTDLKITDINIVDQENGAFKLQSLGQSLPITLQANQSKTIRITFKPTASRKYTDFLDITTTATNAPQGGYMELDLTGFGGYKPQGPVPQFNDDVSDTIFFGPVRTGHPVVDSIKIKNIGNASLFYQSNEMINDGNGTFFYNKTIDSQSPITVDPDSVYYIHIKFNPKKTDTVYTGNIRIDTKDVLGYKDLYFTGKGAPPTPQIFSRDTLLNFGNVQKTLSKDMNFTITNAGNKDLSVDSVDIIQDTNNAYSFVNPPALPRVITYNSGDQQIFTVRFAPQKDDSIEINGFAKIKSDDPNTPYFYIPLKGIGVVYVGVDENTVSDGTGILSLKASPNPFGESTILQFTLNGNTSRNIEIYAIDVLGNKVADILNTLRSPGEYNVNFNAGKLSSGTYFIIAKANDVIVRLPVAVMK